LGKGLLSVVPGDEVVVQVGAGGQAGANPNPLVFLDPPEAGSAGHPSALSVGGILMAQANGGGGGTASRYFGVPGGEGSVIGVLSFQRAGGYAGSGGSGGVYHDAPTDPVNVSPRSGDWGYVIIYY
jgi:hypothetical protein